MKEKIDSTKILVVEDEIILAKDIELTLVRNNFDNIEIVTNYQKAFNQIYHKKPDLILCDINLNYKKDGIDLMSEIKNFNNIPFIIITAYCDSDTIGRIQEISPEAYITKPFTEKQLISTVQLTISKLKNGNQKDIPTNKELLVLKKLANGYSTKQIAEDLCISIHTVETHRKNMLKKYFCKNTAELIYYASSRNWV